MSYSRDRYRLECGRESTIPFFSQAWWLDAVVGDRNWDAVLVEKGGQVVASMPYVLGKRYGFSISTQPLLTQSLGPWLRPSTAKSSKAQAQRKQLMEALIVQLPEVDHFLQNWHYNQTNWLPFHWNGFSQTTRYTYALTNLRDLKQVWDGFDQNIRTDIRKATDRFGLKVRTDLGLEDFLPLHRKVFERQGKGLPYTESLLQRIDEAGETKQARKLFIAEDEHGRHHAGAYVVWDANSAYYLMGGGDPELRNSGATSLCMWEAIQFAANVTQRFDFEGSMLEPVERFFRAFGAEQIPYFQVWRTRARAWRTLEFLRSLARSNG